MMNNLITKEPKESGFFTTAEDIRFYGASTFSYYKGWFKALRSGKYKFYAVGEDTYTSVWLGKVAGSTLASD